MCFCSWVHSRCIQQNDPTNMDPAEQQQALASKAVLLGRHEQVIKILLDNMAVLSQCMCRLAVPGVYAFPATGPAVAASVSTDSYVCDLGTSTTVGGFSYNACWCLLSVHAVLPRMGPK